MEHSIFTVYEERKKEVKEWEATFLFKRLKLLLHDVEFVRVKKKMDGQWSPSGGWIKSISEIAFIFKSLALVFKSLTKNIVSLNAVVSYERLGNCATKTLAPTLFMTKCKSNEFSSKPLKKSQCSKAKEQNQAWVSKKKKEKLSQQNISFLTVTLAKKIRLVPHVKKY